MILKLQWLVNIYTHPNQIPGYAPADWLTDWLIDWQWMPITYTSVAMGSVPVKGEAVPNSALHSFMRFAQMRREVWTHSGGDEYTIKIESHLCGYFLKIQFQTWWFMRHRIRRYAFTIVILSAQFMSCFFRFSQTSLILFPGAPTSTSTCWRRLSSYRLPNR